MYEMHRRTDIERMLRQIPKLEKKSPVFFTLCAIAGFFYPLLWAVAILVFLLQLEEEINE